MMMSFALIAGGSAYAQTKADGNTGATVQKENCDNCKGDKSDKDKKGNKKEGRKQVSGRASRAQFNPFDGIQLTDDQQQKLQVLQQGLGPVELSKEQLSKIPQNPNLTPEQKKQLMQERQSKKLDVKKNYLNGVKEILTPDQYVVFLENVYLYSPQDQGKTNMIKAAQGRKHDKDHKAKDRKDQKEKKDKK